MERKKLKGNFTTVPNNILEALIKAKVSGTEIDVILAIIRTTLGYQKELAEIAYLYLSKQTGLDRSYCIKLVKNLRRRKIVKKISGDSKTSKNWLGINSNTNEWQVELRGSDSQLTSDLQDTSSSDLGVTTSSDSQITHKINNKEINKERVEKTKQQIRERHPFLIRRGNNE